MMMRRVVENGTGKRAQVPGYIVGGKSGTANIATPTGYLEAYNSSFVGVAPLNDPRLTVLVVINNPKGGILGSVVAAPVVQDVLEKSLNYMKIQKTEEVDEKDEFISVPNVGGLLLEDAGKILIDSGLRFNNNSENVLPYSVVTNQSPSAGSYVLKDTIIDLAVNDKDSGILIMPDLSKKTRKESQSILNSMNLEYNIKGNGDFISQSPRPGQKLSGNESVTLNYSKIDQENISDETNKNTNNSSNETNLKNKKNLEENKNSKKDKRNKKDIKKSKKNTNNKKENRNNKRN